MKLPGFVGPSNVLASTLEDCELSINEFTEKGAPGTPKEDDWLRRRPGLRFLFSVGSDPVTCLFCQETRAFGIAGTTFFEINTDDTFTVRGTVAIGDFFPTMCSNGSDGVIFIVSGLKGYVFTLLTNTLTLVVDPDFPTNPTMCEFFAGYFIVLVENSRIIQWSALEDPTAWDALDIFERSWAGDWINFIKRYGTHVWLVGEQTSEVLYLTGGVEVFAPAQESLIEHGSAAHFAGIRMPAGIMCVDQDERGFGQVVQFQGLQPQSVSTNAINLEVQLHQGVLSVMWAYGIQMDGHLWYVLDNDRATDIGGRHIVYTLTPVFDVSTNQWHHWAHWDVNHSVWVPFRGHSYMTFSERHYIGDRLTGAVYDYSFANLTDTLAVV